jgi:hypothetical protein
MSATCFVHSTALAEIYLQIGSKRAQLEQHSLVRVRVLPQQDATMRPLSGLQAPAKHLVRRQVSHAHVQMQKHKQTRTT